MPSSHLILCRPLLLLPLIPPSIRDFFNESALHRRWPKYWSFSFSIIPSKEIPGLISFRMDWLDLPAVQRSLKSLLQHQSSKSSILRCSAFYWLPYCLLKLLSQIVSTFSVCVCVYVYIYIYRERERESSVTQLCPTFWDPMNGSTPGFPVLHYFPEFAQTHVH